jgi:hypothetical protein
MAFLYVIVLCAVAVVAAKTWRFYRTLRRIPSPPGRPIIGNLLQFMSKPRCVFPRLKTNLLPEVSDRLFIKARAFSAKYYPIYRLSTFYFTVAVLLDPNDVEVSSTFNTIFSMRFISLILIVSSWYCPVPNTWPKAECTVT